MPSNLMTPRIFADRVAQQLSDLENVEVYARYVWSFASSIFLSIFLFLFSWWILNNFPAYNIYIKKHTSPVKYSQVIWNKIFLTILQSNYLWLKSYKPKHQPLINYFVLFFLFFVRDQSWAEENKMGAFLSVGKGSTEPSVFLEMKYSGAKTKDSSPLVFVGKGKSSWNPACCKINAFSYPLPFTKLGKWVTGLYYFQAFSWRPICHKDFAVLVSSVLKKYS